MSVVASSKLIAVTIACGGEPVRLKNAMALAAGVASRSRQALRPEVHAFGRISDLLTAPRGNSSYENPNRASPRLRRAPVTRAGHSMKTRRDDPGSSEVERQLFAEWV